MFKKILVPIDGSSTANRGLQEAIKIAKDHDSKLLLIHVVDELLMTQTYDGLAWVPAQHFDEPFPALLKVAPVTPRLSESAVST